MKFNCLILTHVTEICEKALLYLSERVASVQQHQPRPVVDICASFEDPWLAVASPSYMLQIALQHVFHNTYIRKKEKDV